ncbi:MAG: flagellar assembly peptidoglycan hydrolase FlgJ [Pseudomonadota bacterium]
MLAAVDLSDRLSVDVQGAQALRRSAAAGDPGALKAAAREFEAMFVQMMLKSMRATEFTGEQDVYGSSSTLKMYREMLDQQWARQISRGHGLGLADAVVKRLGVEAQGQAWQERLSQVQASAEVDPVGNEVVPARPSSGSVTPASTPEAVAAPTSQSSAQPGGAAQTKQDFIDRLLPHAQAVEAETGIPARFMIAQAALESGWGKREIRTAEGGASHNLFGIKATGWHGQTAEVTTTEYRQGLAMKVSQSFRAYADYGEAFADYARLLGQKYGLQDVGNDPETFVATLVKGGYATDPAYASKLRGVIASVSEVLA